jgi:hypothetical protein
MAINRAGSSSVETVDGHMSALLKESSSTLYHGGVDPMELLDHFYQTTDPLWMGSAQCQSLLQQHTARLALGSPFLLHAMLAFSAYHICSLCPEQQGHKVAGAWHYSHALQSYRQAINEEGVDPDALFACCMLLNQLSFKHLSNDPSSFDIPNRQKSLAVDIVGIRFIGGPRILADAFSRQPMFDQGIWQPLIHCEQSHVRDDEMLASSPGASQSMAALDAICRADEINGPFDTALESLRLLMQCYVSDRPSMVEFTFCFAIKLDPRFLSLVEESVPNALLVMCYWYALVTHVDQWWACHTAQIEGIKLLRYLQDTQDLAVQALLDFPVELLNARPPAIKLP